MNCPSPDDFIDVHTHGSKPSEGIFSVENLMAHENRTPVNRYGIAFTAGIHPWYLTEENSEGQLEYIGKLARDPNIVAIGEAGFDKLKGPALKTQGKIFQEQAEIARSINKPLIIHCVRAWEELLYVHKKLKPQIPWMVHGFRGKKELGLQLISNGMYISFWFDFIMRPEAAALVSSLPRERIFLETDGADIKIQDIYRKVANDLSLSVDDLKKMILGNYTTLFMDR
jgi:TatD DNase family protein